MLNLLRDQFFVLNVFIYLFSSRLSHDTYLDISATAFLKTKNYFFFKDDNTMGYLSDKIKT